MAWTATAAQRLPISRALCEIKMEEFRYIQNLEIKVMDSDPSSLGTINYYMVMSDADNFPEGVSNLDKLICTFPNNLNREFEDVFFVLHNTNSSLGDQIAPLSVTDQGSDQFTSNIVVYDECNEHHCLAVTQDSEICSLISGSYLVCFSDKIIDSYQELLAHDDFYSPLNMCRVNKKQFWQSYGVAVEQWVKNVKIT